MPYCYYHNLQWDSSKSTNTTCGKHSCSRHDCDHSSNLEQTLERVTPIAPTISHLSTWGILTCLYRNLLEYTAHIQASYISAQTVYTFTRHTYTNIHHAHWHPLHVHTFIHHVYCEYTHSHITCSRVYSCVWVCPHVYKHSTHTVHSLCTPSTA